MNIDLGVGILKDAIDRQEHQIATLQRDLRREITCTWVLTVVVTILSISVLYIFRK